MGNSNPAQSIQRQISAEGNRNQDSVLVRNESGSLTRSVSGEQWTPANKTTLRQDSGSFQQRDDLLDRGYQTPGSNYGTASKSWQSNQDDFHPNTPQGYGVGSQHGYPTGRPSPTVEGPGSAHIQGQGHPLQGYQTNQVTSPRTNQITSPLAYQGHTSQSFPERHSYRDEPRRSRLLSQTSTTTTQPIRAIQARNTTVKAINKLPTSLPTVRTKVIRTLQHRAIKGINHRTFGSQAVQTIPIRRKVRGTAPPQSAGSGGYGAPQGQEYGLPQGAGPGGSRRPSQGQGQGVRILRPRVTKRATLQQKLLLGPSSRPRPCSRLLPLPRPHLKTYSPNSKFLLPKLFLSVLLTFKCFNLDISVSGQVEVVK